MRSSLPALLPLLLLLLASTGCDSPRDKDQDRSAPNTPSPSATQPTPEPVSSPGRAAEIPYAPIGLVDEKLHQDPSKDEWQGELFNDAALAQLKALGKVFTHPEKLAPDALAPFTHSSFKPLALVPANLQPRFQDPALLIKRAPEERGPTPPDPTSFAAAIQSLLAPFQDATGLRTEFKIFGVNLESGQPVSDSWFQISGQTKTGMLSRRAKWRCRWHWEDPDHPPLLKSIAISEFEESAGQGSALFSDATASVFKDTADFAPQFGRGTEHWSARIESRYGIGLAGWHGLAVGDVNGDGLDDLYVCEPGGLPNRLFIARPDGTVLDASALSGTNFRLQTQCALLLDLDNDGDQDLVLATTLGIVFMENDGRGAFTTKTRQFVPEAACLALAAADYDLDGDLDLYVGCYSLRRTNVESQQLLGRPIPYHDANNGGRNVLLRNDRNWRFTNATLDLGLDQNNRRFTLAACWEDYDDDGDPDLYVANDYGRNNLYRNDRDENGHSTFVDVAKDAGVEDISAGMSVTWGDADGDGDRDLYISNMWSSAGNRIAFQRNFLTNAGAIPRSEFQRHARGNSLFLNNGDGTFSDASLETRLTMGRWAWGSLFADLNNDGRNDLLVANGFITQPDDTGDL